VLVFEQLHFLRFHNAANSGRTCIYFGKLFKTMSYVQCKQSFFKKKFGRQAPVKNAIAKMMKKFRKTGSLLDKNRNRQKSVLTPGILQDILTAITRSPHKYLRKLIAQMGISLGSAHTAVRKMLKFYELILGDNAK
jgi:hypothetical protein